MALLKEEIDENIKLALAVFNNAKEVWELINEEICKSFINSNKNLPSSRFV